MDAQAAIDALEREAAGFADLITAADLSLPVHGCPGWTLADLARHLGGIHRWAREAVLVGPSDEPPGPADEDEIRPWFQAGAAALVATLRTADPDQPCWTLAEPRAVRFWIRRQLQETTLHRWDAATARGLPARIDDAVAADGIDEIVAMFTPRQVRLGRLRASEDIVELVASTGVRTVLRTGPAAESAAPTASISGSAEALLLLLWKRITLADGRLDIEGDAAVAERLLSRPLTP